MGSNSAPLSALVGRDRELEPVDRLLDALGSGDGGAVHVTGPPGIGKSALLAHVLERADRRGYATLAGRAAEFEQDLPFALFAHSFEGRLASGELGWLGLLDPDAATERHRLLRSLHNQLEALGADRPLVLALDDLHWADSASIDVVCRLLHRGMAGPSLLLLASRPAHSEPRLRTAVEDAERRGYLQRIALGPLSPPAAEALLGAVADPAVREIIYRESGGNPLYLKQLAAAGDPGALAGGAAAGRVGLGVPPAVAAAIRAELDALSPQALGLLQGAAAVGDPFEHDIAAEAANLLEPEALVALDELVRSDLVRSAGGPRSFRFRHPIVHRAVYEATGAGWRIGAHARADAALERQGAPARVRAPHIERSARVGEQAAIALLTEAGQQMLSTAPASAAHWFGAALRLVPDRGSETALPLIAQHAAALGVAGHIQESRDALHEFLERAPQEPTELRLGMAVLATILDELLGTHAVGREVLLAELARLPDQAGPAAAELEREIAFTWFLDADWAATADWAQRALACECEGMVRVGALAALALAEVGRGDVDGARRSVAQAASVFNGMSDARIAAHQPGITIWLGWAEVCTERFADAIAHLERGVRVSRAAGQRHLTLGLLAVQGQALVLSGRINELDALAEAAAEDALLTASDLFLSWAMTLRSQASLHAGDLHEAVRFGERGTGAAAVASSPLSGIARLQLASALLEIGEPERCRALLTTPDGRPDLPPFPLFEALCFELLTAAELALGDRARAELFAARAEQGAERLAIKLPLVQALRARAAVLLDAGDFRAAGDKARAACDAADAAGVPVEQARARIVLGVALAAMGEREAAVAELQVAREELTRRGAVHYADVAARELRRLGRAVALRAGEGTGALPALGLTQRELDVMELVVAGKKNREIAEQLFLSVRTVDRHLSRIFEKLGINSRAAAASIFERARRQPPDAA